MILMIDNYDSFTYNLVRYFEELGQEVVIRRNDALRAAEVGALAPSHLVISPGPKTPTEAGVSLEVIRRYAGIIPILGVCLGHQAIGVAHGARLVRAARLVHGKTSRISHTGTGIFRGLPSPLTVARYHSLILDPASIPPALEVTAWTDQGEIMAVAHRRQPIFGVQFHPESILSEAGHALLERFLEAV